MKCTLFMWYRSAQLTDSLVCPFCWSHLINLNVSILSYIFHNKYMHLNHSGPPNEWLHWCNCKCRVDHRKLPWIEPVLCFIKLGTVHPACPETFPGLPPGARNQTWDLLHANHMLDHILSLCIIPNQINGHSCSILSIPVVPKSGDLTVMSYMDVPVGCGPCLQHSL